MFITKPTKLKYKSNCLYLEGIDKDELSIPMEDILSIVVENNESKISSYLLSKCSELNIPIFFCDSKHLPIGVLTSFQTHSRQLKRLKHQLGLSKPFQKRIWQKIIQSKIKNQAKVLELNQHFEESNNIFALASQVKSGDSDNLESSVANKYFKILFGKYFSRYVESEINTILNYGYSILRGLIARTIVAYGLLPSIGIFHKNEYNNFNLADDLIEPFRPIVDLYASNKTKYQVKLNKEIKCELISLLQNNIIIDNKVVSVSYAIDIFVKSFVSTIEKNDLNELLLPEITELSIHKYE
ncbi:MAG: type II CRISPR-associated endonuclease Cas1 [Candidatus Dojkabacteria bacterium]|nr:type II CRISPR-associated endonuclease Cas1 [Candidatus Dojkabacteria bacterium]